MSKPPQELPTTKEVDTLIAHEMASLSKKDREDALGDLHGVERSPIEDKAFIDKCLVEIDASLTRMKTKSKTKTDSITDVYSLAESMSKEYVENRAFRLKFLVAEEFKPEDAAERLVRFLELKRNLFGEEKLVQEITLEDFSKEDMRSLETGHVQVLPIHDMCGRSIVFGARSLRQNATNRQSLVSLLRIHTFCFWNLSFFCSRRLNGLWFVCFFPTEALHVLCVHESCRDVGITSK